MDVPVDVPLNPDDLMVGVKIDYEGNQKKEALFTVEESEISTVIESCKQISSDEVLIYGKKKKENRYVKIKLK